MFPAAKVIFKGQSRSTQWQGFVRSYRHVLVEICEVFMPPSVFNATVKGYLVGISPRSDTRRWCRVILSRSTAQLNMQTDRQTEYCKLW